LQEHTDNVSCCAISSERQLLLTGGEFLAYPASTANKISLDLSATVCVWSLASGICIQKMAFEFQGPITAVQWITFQEPGNAGGVAGFAVGTVGGFIILNIEGKETVIIFMGSFGFVWRHH
jgi:hypothetical protein